MKIEKTFTTLEKTLKEKDKEYGNMFSIEGEMLLMLFDNEYREKDNVFLLSTFNLENMLYITRVIDKLCAIVTKNKDKKDIWLDIAGYAILALSKENQKEDINDER